MDPVRRGGDDRDLAHSLDVEDVGYSRPLVPLHSKVRWTTRPWASFGVMMSSREYVFAEGGDVVFVGTRHLLDQSIQTETFEQARNRPAVEMSKEATQAIVLQPTDVELAAQDGLTSSAAKRASGDAHFGITSGVCLVPATPG